MGDGQGAMRAATAGSVLRRARRGLRLGLLLLAAMSALGNLLLLSPPLYSMALYDRVLTSGSVDTLLLLSLIALAAYAALGVLDAARTCLARRLGAWLELQLLTPAVAAALEGGHDGRPQQAAARLREALAGPALCPLLDAPFVPLWIGLCWLLHPWIGWTALLGCLALVGLAFLNDRLAGRQLREAAAAQGRLQRRLEAVLRHADLVRALGMAPSLLGAVARDQARGLGAALQAGERSGWIAGGARSLRLGLQSGVMGLGACLVLEHRLTGGAMIAASVLLGRALAPAEQALASLKPLLEARLAWRDLARSLAEAEPRQPAHAELPAVGGRLRLDRVTIGGADGGEPLIADLSLTLRPGELLAVVGPSGSGKSTLLKVASGIVPPAAGRVRLDGLDLAAWPAAQLRRSLGYAPQDGALFEGSVAQNVARMAGDPDIAQVYAATALAGCHAMILGLPGGYATRVEADGRPLSGGQRQRLALARAVFGEPRLVLLDEPDMHLDGEAAASLRRMLVEVKRRGCAVMLATHTTALGALADRVLAIRGPRDLVLGPRREVMQEIVDASRRGRAPAPAALAAERA